MGWTSCGSRRLSARRSATSPIFSAGHTLHALSQLCPRIGLMEAGVRAAQGSVNDIYRHLGLMRIVHVQVVEMNDELVSRIKAVPGVNSVEPQVDRLAIRLHEDQTSIEDLHDHLVAAGRPGPAVHAQAMDVGS